MPRHVIKHSAGAPLGDEVRSMLARVFKREEIDKLETLGGTVELVVSTAPRGIKKKPGQEIDEAYLGHLREMAESGANLSKELVQLNGKQLREICRNLELPTSSQLTNRQLLTSIENALAAPRRWRQIIEQKPHSG